MNTNKILKIINKEETEYFNKSKDYSIFLKHFKITSFLDRIGVCLLLFSPIVVVPLTIITTEYFMPYSHDKFTLLFILLFTALFCSFSHVFNKLYYKIKFLYSKNDTKKQNEYLRKALMYYFNEKSISDNLLNHLKLELSEEQYIALISANKEPTYKEVKDLIEKEISIQSIKDSQRNITLTSDEMDKYSKNNDDIKLNTI